LQLVAATLELARAELADPRRLAKLLGAHVPPSWPPPLNDEHSQRWTVDYLAANPDGVGWGPWYFLHREHGELRAVGVGGFRGKPSSEGMVEIGYSIVPESHRFGFAPEAVRALVAWAFAHPSVARVTAQTLPELRPSIRVLEKCGFHSIGKGWEEGAIAFELTRPRVGE
jgi:RimJ/RimL family protein N-acetyltransferase